MASAPAPDSTNVQMQSYIRKSKMLLVGLSNMKSDTIDPEDLAREREASHALAREARALQARPIDSRSRRLVGDLEKIWIELANSPPSELSDQIDVIRNGIHKENLLFRIRMEERMYGTIDEVRHDTSLR
jgi:hypothetical protein